MKYQVFWSDKEPPLIDHKIGWSIFGTSRSRGVAILWVYWIFFKELSIFPREYWWQQLSAFAGYSPFPRNSICFWCVNMMHFRRCHYSLGNIEVFVVQKSRIKSVWSETAQQQLLFSSNYSTIILLLRRRVISRPLLTLATCLSQLSRGVILISI